MNARIFKKKCKQAMNMLVFKYGFRICDFIKCESGESWPYKKNFTKKFPRYQRFSYSHPMSGNYIKMAKGTPLFSWFDSYAGDGDSEPAIDTMRMVVLYSDSDFGSDEN